jgi:hypothetical protein
LGTKHNDLPFGRADAPSPFPAALFQHRFKDWQSTAHDQATTTLREAYIIAQQTGQMLIPLLYETTFGFCQRSHLKPKAFAINYAVEYPRHHVGVPQAKFGFSLP